MTGRRENDYGRGENTLLVKGGQMVSKESLIEEPAIGQEAGYLRRDRHGEGAWSYKGSLGLTSCHMKPYSH